MKAARDELNERYQGKSIKQLENQIRTDLKKSREAEGEAIRVLHYLERTGRFKENPQYKRATFEKYIENEHGMKYSRYLYLRNAYSYWPYESVEYGGHVLAKATRKIGARRMPSFLSSLTRAAAKRKTPLSIEKIENTIKEHAPKAKVKQNNKAVNYEAEYKRERKERLRLESENRALIHQREALIKQVRALKKKLARMESRGLGFPVIPVHSSATDDGSLGFVSPRK